MNPIKRLVAALKQFSMRWQGAARWGWSSYPGTQVDYAGLVNDGRGNSVVEAVVGLVARTFPEAPVEVRKLTRDGADPVRDHPLVRLLRRPNPYYGGVLLWQATLGDWLRGNAYWVKVGFRQRGDRELWWVPATMIEPAWPADGSAFISHYVYSVDGRQMRLERDDVVHFRNGFDPMNPRKGLSPLGALLREIYTDDEGAQYTATMLRNLGVPGVVLSPGKEVEVTQDAADEVKAQFMARFSGDHRGEPLVMRAETSVSVLSFSPEQMTLRDLRRLPEERITAVFGVPAIVVGLGAGLERSTFANYAEAREAFYESNIIPTQRLFAEELATQLLPDFEAKPEAWEIGFDLSAVRVLQADEDKLVERSTRALLAGGITVDEYRVAIGQAPLPSQQGEVLYVPTVVKPTTPADLLAAPAPLPAPTPLRALPEPEAAGRRYGLPLIAPMAGTAWDMARANAEALRAASPLVYGTIYSRKSADDVVPALERARDGAVPLATNDLAAYLVAQQHAVIAQLERPSKAMADVQIGDDDEARLRAILEPYYRALLEGAHAATQAGLGVAFGLPDALTTEYLQAAGGQIGGITETTRQAVATALQAGQAAGEGIPELARRLRALPEFNRARAELVARTELGSAANEAAVTTYRASGVVAAIRVLDSDADPLCAAWNGRVVPLSDQASVPRLGHPNCVRALAPVTDAAAGQGAA